MEFPLYIAPFRLVNHSEEAKNTTYVRYLYKFNMQLIYVSFEKKKTGYMYRTELLSAHKEEWVEKYCSTEERAMEALLSFISTYSENH